MAQPQQAQYPPRTFSPTQQSPSPVGSQPGYPLPPNKRMRTDGPSPQPGSPYAVSPLATSPAPAGTPPATGSPAFAPAQPAAPMNMPTPYTNGQSTPTLLLPEARPSPTPSLQTPQPLPSPSAPFYTTATMAPIMGGSGQRPAQTPGSMGPPQRPADRPTKDYEYDVTDSLAGTGIDLRAEEQYLSDMMGNSFDEARTGFAQYPPGPRSSFYGAGPANQRGETPLELDQTKFEAQEAERAWYESAHRLAAQRTQEILDPFLMVALLHRRAEKIAKEHHLGLNLDLRTSQGVGRMVRPEHFNNPTVTVKTSPGPDSVTVQTTGSWIPHDAFLADQLALISIATKQRLRELVQDADIVASNRQTTSHGEIPSEWEAASAPLNVEPLEPMDRDEANGEGEPTDQEDITMTNGTDNAVDPDSHLGKRSAEEAGLTKAPKHKPAKMAKIASYLTLTMRDAAKREREWEEARLRRRQKRQEGLTDTGHTTSRSNSIAPSTPGALAVEAEKPMTKKEMKKSQALKAAEANNHVNQNITSSMFAGLGGRSGLFGKGKAGKTYDWMTVGRSGSGTSTPTKTAGGAKGAMSGGMSPNAGPQPLTTEGRNRLGTWREDKEKGKNIQLRDWVNVLERDGRELKALQAAYLTLDNSTPR